MGESGRFTAAAPDDLSGRAAAVRRGAWPTPPSPGECGRVGHHSRLRAIPPAIAREGPAPTLRRERLSPTRRILTRPRHSTRRVSRHRAPAPRSVGLRTDKFQPARWARTDVAAPARLAFRGPSSLHVREAIRPPCREKLKRCPARHACRLSARTRQSSAPVEASWTATRRGGHAALRVVPGAVSDDDTKTVEAGRKPVRWLSRVRVECDLRSTGRVELPLSAEARWDARGGCQPPLFSRGRESRWRPG